MLGLKVENDARIDSTNLSIVAFNGAVQDFSAGAGTRFAQWGNGDSNLKANSILIPFDCKVIGFTAVYSNVATPIGIDPAEMIDITVGTVAPLAAASDANYTPIPGLLLQFLPTDDGTFPEKSLTNVSVDFPKGGKLAVRSDETGSVVPPGSELNVTVWFECTVS